MPELGDKVGDVYIEVHAEVDKNSLVKTQKEVATKVAKAEKDLTHKLVRDKKEAIEKAHINALQMEKARIQEMGRLQVRALAEDKRRYDDKMRHQMRMQREWYAQAEKIRKDFEKKQERDTRRPRPGSNNRGSSLGQMAQNLLSILPGQLEKLLANPIIAGAAVAVGAGLAGFIAQGLAGALATGVGGGIVVGAIVTLVKKDKLVAQAFGDLGRRSMDAWLEQVVKFKPQVITLFQSLGNDISGFIRSLDLSQLIGSMEPIRQGTSDFLKEIQPGIQALIDVAGPLLRDLFEEILPGIGEAFTSMAKVIRNNGGEIRLTMKAIGLMVEAALTGFGKLVSFGAAAVGRLLDLNMGALQAARTVAQAWNAIADKVPGGDKLKIDLGGINQQISTLSGNRAKLDDFSYTLGEVGTGLDGIADSAAGAVPPARSLAEQMEAQATAFQNAYDKQKQFDSALRTGMETSRTYEQLVDDISGAIKTNGRTLDQRTQQGRDNFGMLESGFKGLKETYLEDVRENKISSQKAREEFTKRAVSMLNNFDKGSPAYKALQQMIDKLNEFPDNKNMTVNVDTTSAQINIRRLQEKLEGLGSAGEQAGAKAIIEKNKAGGGAVFGRGTSTSDSIPANLSNGEFVIKASSARSIGYGNLSRMNKTGRTGFASGGQVGRGSSASEKNAYEALLKQITALNKTIATQTKTLAAYNAQVSASREQFKSFVNLSALDTQGKSTGDLIQQLAGRKAAAGGFASRLKSLKSRGLSAEALKQVSEAGPDSPLAKMLMSATDYDIKKINSLLTGGGGYAAGIAGAIVPGGAGMAASIAANKKKLAATKKKAAKLKPVMAKGASIRYSGGKATALFSSKELAQQQLKQGTYVTVVIDGKEVRAIVKEEQRKVTSKSNRQMKSGRG